MMPTHLTALAAVRLGEAREALASTLTSDAAQGLPPTVQRPLVYVLAKLNEAIGHLNSPEAGLAVEQGRTLVIEGTAAVLPVLDPVPIPGVAQAMRDSLAAPRCPACGSREVEQGRCHDCGANVPPSYTGSTAGTL